MSVKSGQSISAVFTTANPTTGGAENASPLPTGVLYINGVQNAATVTVVNKAVGVYSAGCTLPTLPVGQLASICISATVNGVVGEGVIWQDITDSKIVSDLTDLTAGAVWDGIQKPLEALATYDVATEPNATANNDAVMDALAYYVPPTEGVPITPATLGTDGLPLGRVMPFGVITVYLATVIKYRFVADADGDYSYHLPVGSVWTLIARHNNYEDALAEVSTIAPIS